MMSDLHKRIQTLPKTGDKTALGGKGPHTLKETSDAVRKGMEANEQIEKAKEQTDLTVGQLVSTLSLNELGYALEPIDCTNMVLASRKTESYLLEALADDQFKVTCKQ